MDRRKFLKISGLGVGGALITGLGVNMFGGFGSKENYYLQGNYAPVKELVTETNLEVIGSIPKDLSGLLLRNGPNPMESAQCQETSLVRRRGNATRGQTGFG